MPRFGLATISPSSPDRGKSPCSLREAHANHLPANSCFSWDSPFVNILEPFLFVGIFTSFDSSLSSRSHISNLSYQYALILHKNLNSYSNELHSDYHKRQHNASYEYPIFLESSHPYHILASFRSSNILCFCNRLSNALLMFRLSRNSSLCKSVMSFPLWVIRRSIYTTSEIICLKCKCKITVTPRSRRYGDVMATYIREVKTRSRVR